MRVNRNYGVHKYADGGKVELNKKAKKGGKKKADPKMLGSGAAAKAGEAIRDTRKRQMDELGLKDGGKVKMKPHVPERRKSPILEKAGSPGGSQTPGEKGTYPMPKKPKKMACGGKVKR